MEKEVVWWVLGSLLQGVLVLFGLYIVYYIFVRNRVFSAVLRWDDFLGRVKQQLALTRGLGEIPRELAELFYGTDRSREGLRRQFRILKTRLGDVDSMTKFAASVLLASVPLVILSVVSCTLGMVYYGDENLFWLGLISSLVYILFVSIALLVTTIRSWKAGFEYSGLTKVVDEVLKKGTMDGESLEDAFGKLWE